MSLTAYVTVNSSAPIPFLPVVVTTAMSYVATTASDAIVMFAVSEVELLTRVLLTTIFGYGTPFDYQIAREPLSNPDPVITGPIHSGTVASTGDSVRTDHRNAERRRLPTKLAPLCRSRA